MKIPSSKANQTSMKSGFALIFSLLAILLLVTLVVGLLIFVRSQQKITQPVLEGIRAEANANLAASLALGKIQSFLGPDQRATARAENAAVGNAYTFFDEDAYAALEEDNIIPEHRHWVGVWDTEFRYREFPEIPYPIIGSRDDNRIGSTQFAVGIGPFGNQYIRGIVDRRYSRAGLNKPLAPVRANVLAWMFQSADEGKAFGQLSRPRLMRGYLVSGEKVDLVGGPTHRGPNPFIPNDRPKATLARYLFPDPENPSTYSQMNAQAEIMDANSKEMDGFDGSYAYLAIDSSQKSSLKINPFVNKSSLTIQEKLHSEILSQAPSLSALPTLPDSVDSELIKYSELLPTSIEEALNLSLGGDEEDWQRVESAIAFQPNLGILSNSRLGGLKQDLSAFLQASDNALSPGGSFDGTPVVRFDTIRETNADGKADNGTTGGTNWTLSPADASSNTVINPIIPGDGFDELGPTFDALRHHLKLGEYVQSSDFANGSLPLSSRVQKLGDDSEAGWQSVLSKHRGFPLPSASTSDPQGAIAQRLHPIVVEAGFWWNISREELNGEDRIALHIYPKVILWNPYNVPLSEQNYVINMPGSIFGEEFFVHELIIYFGTTSVISGDTITADEQFFINDVIFDNDVNKMENFYFHIPSTALQPGEAAVFTASPSADSVVDSSNEELLTHSSGTSSAPYQFSNIFLNTLSATKAPDSSSFHIYNQGFLDPDPIELIDGGTPVIDIGYEINTFFERSENFYLHVVNPEYGLSPTSIDDMKSESFVAENIPLIQRIYSDLSGSHEAGKYTDHVAGFYSSPVNDYPNRFWASFEDTVDKDGNEVPGLGGERPPRLWNRKARLHMMDESTESESNRAVSFGFNLSDKMLRRPMIMTHNFRHHTNSRSPSSPYLDPPFLVTDEDLGLDNDIFAFHSGGMYYLPWGDPALYDDSRTDPFFNSETGRFNASPYIFVGEAGQADKFVLFEIPEDNFVPSSLLHLQDADFSPFQWSSSYPLGSGIADPRADYDTTVLGRLVRNNPFESTKWGKEQWETPGIPILDFFTLNMEDVVGYDEWSNQGEQLIYDLGYKLNHYLLDDFFLSSLPYNTDNEFTWNWSDPLLNSRLKAWPASTADRNDVASSGLQSAASMLYNEGAFNVNSTDVNAWIAFLASTRNKVRTTIDSSQVGSRNGNETLFTRLLRPVETAESLGTSFEDAGSQSGIFLLSDADIQLLAEKIVQVNLERGPALTVAEFVSRPLISDNIPTDGSSPISRRSRLEEAIWRCGFNSNLLNSDVGSQSSLLDKVSSEIAPDPEVGDGFRDNTTIPEGAVDADGNELATPTKDDDFLMDDTLIEDYVTWGLPGHLMQQDILEPLLPSMTTRGDTFVIRCLGSSQQEGEGAKRILEITLQRLPEYLHAQERSSDGGTSEFGNLPEAPLVIENRQTGNLSLNDEMAEANARFGRRFRIVSRRWITENDL